jgi:hypothetical protein
MNTSTSNKLTMPLDEHTLLVHGQRPWPLLGFDFAQGLLSELCAQLPHLPLDMLTFDIQ